MPEITNTLLLLGGFAIVAVAANQIAGLTAKLKTNADDLSHRIDSFLEAVNAA